MLGAFISDRLHCSAAAYGDPKCFLFTLMPQEAVYPWRGVSHDTCFIQASIDRLMIGVGSAGCGLSLDDMLENGTSARSDTFQNEPLCDTEVFKVLRLEVYDVV